MSINDIMRADLTPLFTALPLILVLGAAIVGILVYMHTKSVQKAPMLRKQGKILSIRPTDAFYNEVIVELQDGSRLRLISKKMDSSTFVVGDTGVFTYQKSELIRFERDVL